MASHSAIIGFTRALATVAVATVVCAGAASALAANRATVTALSATDAPGTGSDVSVTSSVTDNIGQGLLNASMTYVIWWDQNGNATFDSGDTWIDSSGAPHTWDGVSGVSSHVTSGITVPKKGTWTEPSAWSVNNALFPQQGNYNITATLRDSAGLVVDQRSTSFYSIPALGWPLLLTGTAAAAFVYSRRRTVIEGGAS